jgi:hypothetical protein
MASGTTAPAPALFDPAALARLVGVFQDRFGTFDNPEYLAWEPNYKRAAAARMRELLAKDRLGEQIAQGRFEDAKADIKHACEGTYSGQQNNLLNQWDRLPIYNAPAEELARGLYALLYGSALFPGRFAPWIDLLAREKQTCWPAATYFLMLHQPDRHIFIKSTPFNKLLGSLQSPIVWATRPNPAKYAEFQRLGRELLEALKPLGAKDMIDVQSFVWILFPTK